MCKIFQLPISMIWGGGVIIPGHEYLQDRCTSIAIQGTVYPILKCECLYYKQVVSYYYTSVVIRPQFRPQRVIALL